MATMFQSESAIERATGMTCDEWLDFNGYGERKATTRTLTNLTESERVEREREARVANLDRLEQLASAGMPLFVHGDVNGDEIESTQFADDDSDSPVEDERECRHNF